MVHVTHLWPEASTARIDSTPAPRESERLPYLRFPAPGPVQRVHYLHLLQPMRADSGEPVSAERVIGQGGIGMRVSGPEETALAVFRQETDRLPRAG